MQRSTIYHTISVLGVALLMAMPASAAVPHLVRYQGYLTDEQGAPIDSPRTMTFRLFDTDNGGTEVWSETQPDVPVMDGNFSVLLGSVDALDVTFDSDLWLEIEMAGDTPMTPRTRVTAVPTAYRAEVAEGLSDPNAHPGRSKQLIFARGPAQGPGTVALTGVGFAPTALQVACLSADFQSASWGYADEATADTWMADIIESGASQYRAGAGLVSVQVEADATDGDLISLDPDGFTIKWTMRGAGLDVDCRGLATR